jgi:DNA polymerase III epsilon subunit-like protein
MMAREMHPGKKNSLTPCGALHGGQRAPHAARALLDAQLLADVWVAMTRGQESLDISLGVSPAMLLEAHESAAQCVMHVIRATPRSSPSTPPCASASSARARANASGCTLQSKTDPRPP